MSTLVSIHMLLVRFEHLLDTSCNSKMPPKWLSAQKNADQGSGGDNDVDETVYAEEDDHDWVNGRNNRDGINKQKLEMESIEVAKELRGLVDKAGRNRGRHIIITSPANYPLVNAFVEKCVKDLGSMQQDRDNFPDLPDSMVDAIQSFIQDKASGFKSAWIMQNIISYNIAEQYKNAYNFENEITRKDGSIDVYNYRGGPLDPYNSKLWEKYTFFVSLKGYDNIVQHIFKSLRSEKVGEVTIALNTATIENLIKTMSSESDGFIEDLNDLLTGHAEKHHVVSEREFISQYYLNLALHICMDYTLYGGAIDEDMQLIIGLVLDYRIKNTSKSGEDTVKELDEHIKLYRKGRILDLVEAAIYSTDYSKDLFIGCAHSPDINAFVLSQVKRFEQSKTTTSMFQDIVVFVNQTCGDLSDKEKYIAAHVIMWKILTSTPLKLRENFSYTTIDGCIEKIRTGANELVELRQNDT
jgi:hypothetical protein